MNGRKHFQPGPRCGNCWLFRSTERDGSDLITEEAHCGSSLNPRTCGDAFRSKAKRNKSKKRKVKRWQLEANRARDAQSS